MDPKTGVQLFLYVPAIQGIFIGEDIEKAIEYASERSPSSAFDFASKYGRIQFVDQMKALGFAKGVRWLAIIRRDDGQKAFGQQVEELRGLFK